MTDADIMQAWMDGCLSHGEALIRLFENNHTTCPGRIGIIALAILKQEEEDAEAIANALRLRSQRARTRVTHIVYKEAPVDHISAYYDHMAEKFQYKYPYIRHYCVGQAVHFLSLATNYDYN
jgi:hypothetical protein